MAYCVDCLLVNIPSHQICEGCGLCFDCCACQEKAEILNLEDDSDTSCIPAGDVDDDEEEIEG